MRGENKSLQRRGTAVCASTPDLSLELLTPRQWQKKGRNMSTVEEAMQMRRYTSPFASYYVTSNGYRWALNWGLHPLAQVSISFRHITGVDTPTLGDMLPPVVTYEALACLWYDHILHAWTAACPESQLICRLFTNRTWRRLKLQLVSHVCLCVWRGVNPCDVKGMWG